MVEDQGIRRAEVGEAEVKDLSQRAVRISLTKPEYTDDAIDVGLEGTFAVDVFIEKDGSVSDAELRKKIGFGMDERVLAASKSAVFEPRRNNLGVAIAGWDTIVFDLVLPE